MQVHHIATWSEVPDREPVGVLIDDLDLADLTTFDRDLAHLAGVWYGGVTA